MSTPVTSNLSHAVKQEMLGDPDDQAFVFSFRIPQVTADQMDSISHHISSQVGGVAGIHKDDLIGCIRYKKEKDLLEVSMLFPSTAFIKVGRSVQAYADFHKKESGVRFVCFGKFDDFNFISEEKQRIFINKMKRVAALSKREFIEYQGGPVFKKARF